MKVVTLITTYVPKTSHEGLKPAQIRTDQYFTNLLAKFDLGEVFFCDFNNFKENIDAHHPVIIIVLNSYYAQQINEYKNDSFIFCMESPSWVFSRKAEMESRKQKQVETLTHVSDLAKKLIEDKENEERLRKIASMGYKEIYDMIKQMIISEDKELSKKGWEFINEGKGEFVWMRVNMIVDAWEGSDAKGKEKFLNLAMKDFVDHLSARELPNIFTDAEDIQYRQYEFIYPDGNPTGYIRRIPIAKPDMSNIGYDNLLNKYETPNGARMLMEVGQVKNKWKEYTDREADKIYILLKKWKASPNKSHRELGVIFSNGQTSDKPLISEEVECFKKILKAWEEEKYNNLFFN